MKRAHIGRSAGLLGILWLLSTGADAASHCVGTTNELRQWRHEQRRKI